MKYARCSLLLSIVLCGVSWSVAAPTPSPKKAPPTATKSLPTTTTRIKDIAVFEGVRGNQLIGYGLVVGLQGTGDDSKRSPLRESLSGMLERLGVKVDPKSSEFRTRNTAVVMVTATLPPFARHGTHLDVTVSALADAKSLLGGVLLATPLVGADGETYVLAQGPVVVGGYTFGGNAKQGQTKTITKGVPTNGRVPSGGIVEKEVMFELAHQESLRIMLRNPDFTTAKRVSDVINAHEGRSIAHAIDSGTVVLNFRKNKHNLVAFLTQIEQLMVRPDQPARIIFDERDGVIVINENVRIAPVAVAHGSLTIQITEQEQATFVGPQSSSGTGSSISYANTAVKVAQPPQTGVGTGTTSKTDQGTQTSNRLPIPETRLGVGTQLVGNLPPGSGVIMQNQTDINVTPEDDPYSPIPEREKLALLAPEATLQDLVNAVNALGSSPRDLIIILQAIKQAGALQAQLETM
ncbi:MAG: flagellar basal body P-ring protein FlgI [Holosporales bacterium]|jgi:flagellar P-ring protein precursor FlgI|nr:flagellar basal body P-ring protein FlgI [Holosporales bacterium]